VSKAELENFRFQCERLLLDGRIALPLVLIRCVICVWRPSECRKWWNESLL